jgi:hypothetical protein
MRRGALRTFELWIAIFAVLMGALAPTLTQAMQGDGALSLSEVCSQFGPKWVSSADAGSVDRKNAPGALHYEHCPYCSVHAAGLGMPPRAFEVPALPLSHAVHWRYSATTPTLDFWSDALSRGPPAIA